MKAKTRQRVEPAEVHSISIFQHRNKRGRQEDRYVVGACGGGVLLAVLDGHGGATIAERAVTHLLKLFTAALDQGAVISDALRTTVALLVDLCADGGVYDPMNMDQVPAGSTLSMAFIRGNKITLAVLGDSPMLVYLADGTLHISPEHSVAHHAADIAAINARCVDQIMSGTLFIDSDFLTLPRSGEQLQTTRALGDPEFDGIIGREPDIMEYDMSLGGVVLIASDAIAVSNHPGSRHAFYRMIAELAYEGNDATALGQFALDSKHHITDNLTLLVAKVDAVMNK